MKIVGVCLIKNEELYIKQVINNIIDFCDEIIILDNMSTDKTVEIIKTIHSDKITLVSIPTVHSNKYINKYVGTDTWVFGVDGDELYDPNGLRIFRQELETGKWDNYWRIKPAQINVFNLSIETNKAIGYTNKPPEGLGQPHSPGGTGDKGGKYACRPCGKFYNFKHIVNQWPLQCERLHGCKPILNPNVIKSYRINDFETSSFRFLHLCFIKRSTKNHYTTVKKNNIHHVLSVNPAGLQNKYHCFNYKMEKYTRGKPIEVDTTSFF